MRENIWILPGGYINQDTGIYLPTGIENNYITIKSNETAKHTICGNRIVDLCTSAPIHSPQSNCLALFVYAPRQWAPPSRLATALLTLLKCSVSYFVLSVNPWSCAAMRSFPVTSVTRTHNNRSYIDIVPTVDGNCACFHTFN